MHRRDILHFTNGDSAVERLRAGGVEGRIVPWRDVLHDGPVPAEPLDRLRETRATFLAARDWGALEAIRANLAERDAALVAAADEDETTLWFEHDLYDQLQLLQLLDWFAAHPARYLTLAQADAAYLGRMEPDAIRQLWATRRPVSEAQHRLAREGWAAFRAGDPRRLEALLATDTSALPHLAPAIRRLLEELPGTRDGLSRTERQAMRAIADGAPTFGDAFRRATQDAEERQWLGDASFASYLEALGGPRPLVVLGDATPVVAPRGSSGNGVREFWNRRAVLTPLGRQVLAGQVDRVAECGVDRWIGGLRLSGTDVAYRWDGERVVAT